MGTQPPSAKPTTHRHTPEEKAPAVRLVRQLRRELGASRETIKRVADQPGYAVESLRRWVEQADIDSGDATGMSTADRAKMRTLRQENEELRRANEILNRVSTLLAPELDRPQK